MCLVILQMRGSVAINGIFGLKWRHYGPKGGILDYWGTLIFFYHPIISYQRIKVYKVERMDIGKIFLTHWCLCGMQMQPSQ